MATVHSETLGVTITGNTITRHNLSLRQVQEFLYYRDQITLVCTSGKLSEKMFDVSTPMTDTDRTQFVGLIHRMNAENKLGKKLDTNKGKPDTDPTPPGRGGAKPVEFINTEAKAA